MKSLNTAESFFDIRSFTRSSSSPLAFAKISATASGTLAEESSDADAGDPIISVVRLEAANPAYDPIELPAEQVQVQGKLMAVWRQV